MKESDSKKTTIYMRVSVHPIKARLWLVRAKIKADMSLREIGSLIGVDSPQQIKHHLQGMLAMGSIDYVKGKYLFPRS